MTFSRVCRHNYILETETSKRTPAFANYFHSLVFVNLGFKVGSSLEVNLDCFENLSEKSLFSKDHNNISLYTTIMYQYKEFSIQRGTSSKSCFETIMRLEILSQINLASIAIKVNFHAIFAGQYLFISGIHDLKITLNEFVFQNRQKWTPRS